MRIENGDSINIKSSSNAVSTDVSTKSIGAVNNANRSQTIEKSISQIRDYEKDIMPVSERVVIEAIQKANKAISGGNRRFEFSIHDKTNEIVVKVFDSDTNELVREIPNEKVLDMVAKMCEMAGILVDERR